MNELDAKKTKELFARLFVLGVQNKINFSSFTHFLERSELVKKIEEGNYDDYFNQSITAIFKQITNYDVLEDNSYGIYNDAYWCGFSYFEIHQRTGKTFAFIFLKLPLEKMMDIYSIYHEMDVSSLLEFFQKRVEEKTILRALCENKHCSLPKLSSATGINAAILSKYNASDDALYKGSFQNIYKIATFFDVPISLFKN